MPKLGRRFEPQQLQYYYNNAPSAASNAPYGTDCTPWIKSRIVGSKLVPVLERRANPFFHDHQGDQAGVTPRFYPQIVDPIAEKPNYVDPHMLKEYTRKLHSVNQEFNFPNQTTYGRYRPDSKDLAHKYIRLPPIDQNKVKMETSTVFEPESWTRNYRSGEEQVAERTGQHPYDSGHYGSTNYGTGGATIGGVANGYQSPVLYDPPPSQPRETYFKEGPSAREQRDYYDDTARRSSNLERQKYELLKRLPDDTFLPEHPLLLSRDEEEAVLRMVGLELAECDPARLKDVYIDITGNYDRTLSGWCHYKNLSFSLSNAKFALSTDTLRLIAAMFVSPSKLQEVNYEKFLSFIGSSTKDSHGNGFYQVTRQPDGTGWPLELYSPRSTSQNTSPHQYYTNNVDNPKPWSPRASRPSSPYYDSDMSKLVNLTEQQLHDDGIDFERLVARFQMVDREMRETLSAEQIKDVLRKQAVRLQESVINKILSKCADNNSDGQYNWIRFVEFLEKVQPAKTGLPIPRSKKPLEYAKKVPSPVPNWPHASTTEPGALEPVTPLWKRGEPTGPLSNGPLYDRKVNIHDQEQEQLRENRSRIEAMDNELKHLEASYDDMKKKLNSPRGDSPWFKMFMEFANALYKQDMKSTGQLPTDEVLNWTNMYNSSYNLEIPDGAIIRTLGECTTGGRVNIHQYLTQLGSRDWL